MSEADSKRVTLQRAQQLGRRLTTARSQERHARITDAANEAATALNEVLGLPAVEREAAAPLVAPRRRNPRRLLKVMAQHQTVSHVRQQLSLLVTTPASHNHRHTRDAKHQASIWASRYATHAVVLILLFGIALFGGFKGLTVQASPIVSDSISDGESAAASDEGIGSSFNDYDVRQGNVAAQADVAMRAELTTRFSERIKSYTVQAGDTLPALAAKFGLDVPTLMSANHLVDPEAVLKPNDTLLILPVKGMYHLVQPGETVESIAAMYQVEPAAIIGYRLNGLQPPYTLSVGDALIVPGGSLPPRDRIIAYSPRLGETALAIAQKFNLSLATLLLANPDLGDGSNVQSDRPLIIPPLDGIVYVAAEGDSLDSVARYYGTSAKVLTDFAPNQLKPGDSLTVGMTLVIPGGTIPTPTPTSTPLPTDTPEPTDTPRPTTTPRPLNTPRSLVAQANRTAPSSRGNTRPTSVPAAPATPAPKRPEPTDTPEPSNPPVISVGVAQGSFIWPTAGRITQGFYAWESIGRHNGLDIANNAGTAIVAADAGKVIWAGWRTGGFGYVVYIDHGNGYQTIYAHMRSQPAVSVGQWVERGQYIGPMGTTGNSTGNHVHFAVKLNGVLRDPLQFLQ